MSRSGYTDYDGDEDALAMGRWYGRMRSAMRGKRGQQFLRDLIAALDVMPVKRLIAGELRDSDGEVCAIGSVGVRRGVDMSSLCYSEGGTPDDGWYSDWECDAVENAELIASWMDIAPCLALEVMDVNDDHGPRDETPEQRWARVRRWVAKQIRVTPEECGAVEVDEGMVP